MAIHSNGITLGAGEEVDEVTGEQVAKYYHEDHFSFSRLRLKP